ncbi:MAG: AraC family transcriptional regulator [Cyclobacteriaceae bacterium]|nr:AraC family transcriptional regulator [Cyclobacteriaceae bacterium]
MSKRHRSRSSIPRISLWNIDEERLFNAVWFESVPPADMMQYRAHQKNHFVLSYTVTGSFRNYIDFKEKIFHQGDVALINPNHIHFVRPVDKKVIKIIVLAFNRSFFNRLNLSARVNMMTNNPAGILFVKGQNYEKDVIPLLFRSVFQEYKTKQKATPLIVSLMSHLLTQLCEQSNPVKQLPKGNYTYYSFLKLLDEKLSETHRVADYAAALKLSEKSLNRACQAIAQCSAQAIIHQKINYEAKRQLVHNQSSAKEIGYAVGFSDPIQFSKFFKHHNGVTPLEYRKKARSGRLS